MATDQRDDPIISNTSRSVPWIGIIVSVIILLGFLARFYKQEGGFVTARGAYDIAQIARNIARGDGFTTHFIRPFNVPFTSMDKGKIIELNNAPLYPYIAAAMIKFRGAADQPVTQTSMLFLVTAIASTFLLGAILFDWRAGLLAAAIAGISAPVLNIGASGEPWALATALFTLLLCGIGLYHKSAERGRAISKLGYPIICGILLGLLYWTHCVFIFLMPAIAVYFAITARSRRVRPSPLLRAIIFIAVFSIVIAPLMYRNYSLTGSPVMGIGAWDLMAHSDAYPGDTLYRSTDSESHEQARIYLFPIEHFWAFARKLAQGINSIVSEYALMLGIAVLPFGLVSVFYRFKSAPANAVRGVTYALAPAAIVAFALFSTGTEAILILAPVTAVYASAYFITLLRAKKLYPAYSNALIAGLILVTAGPVLPTIIWRPDSPEHSDAATIDTIFGKAGTSGAKGLIYTDAPWAAAWRTECVAVWLPRTDDDVDVLTADGLPMNLVVLTPESSNYSSDEAWYMLHRVSLWREYIQDRKAGMSKILEAAGVSKNRTEQADKALARLRRNYAISRSIEGMSTQRTDPLAPDDVQILTFGKR